MDVFVKRAAHCTENTLTQQLGARSELPKTGNGNEVPGWFGFVDWLDTFSDIGMI